MTPAKRMDFYGRARAIATQCFAGPSAETDAIVGALREAYNQGVEDAAWHLEKDPLCALPASTGAAIRKLKVPT